MEFPFRQITKALANTTARPQEGQRGAAGWWRPLAGGDGRGKWIKELQALDPPLFALFCAQLSATSVSPTSGTEEGSAL